MLNLISEEAAARLLSFSSWKKLAFLVLLYERMMPELCSFCLAEGLDFSVFQSVREDYWLTLMGGYPLKSSGKSREDILNATPDSEDFGTLASSFALNASLVAAEIAEFIEDGQNQRVVDAIGYARDSLDANAIHELGTIVFDGAMESFVVAHPLFQRERRTEEEDVAFLSTMQEAVASKDSFFMLQQRAKIQCSLLDNTVI